MYLSTLSREAVIESFREISIAAAKAHAKAICELDHSLLISCINEIQEELHEVRLVLLGCRIPLDD